MSTAVVTGKVVGATAAGSVTFTPTGWAGWPAASTVQGPSPITVPVAANGSFSATLWRTDNAEPPTWCYRVVCAVPGVSAEPFYIRVDGPGDIATMIGWGDRPTWTPGTPPWALPDGRYAAIQHLHPELPTRTEMHALIDAITGVDVSGVVRYLPQPPTGTAWATLAAGAYQMRSATPTYPDSPTVGRAGTLLVWDAGNATYALRQQLWLASTSGGIWWRSNSSNGVWTAWARLDHLPDDPGAGVHRDVLQAEFRRRRGGAVGTGGLPAVALRFDHWLTAFKSVCLPLLRELGLPWAQAITSGRVGSGQDVMTWGELQAACIQAGGEVANHSATHGNPLSEAAINAEILGALATIRTNLPRLPVEMWMPPGQPAGEYGGYMPVRSPTNFATYAGRLVLANHALTTGYMPPGGYWRPLTGQLLDGLPHYTGDAASLAQLKSRVTGIPAGHGLTVMMHPGLIGEAGMISVADFEVWLRWLAAERDAGRLVVLTPSALAIADASRAVSSITATTIPVQRTGTAGATHLTTATGDGEIVVTTDAGEELTRATSVAGRVTVAYTVPLDAVEVRIALSGTLADPATRIA